MEFQSYFRGSIVSSIANFELELVMADHAQGLNATWCPRCSHDHHLAHAQRYSKAERSPLLSPPSYSLSLISLPRFGRAERLCSRALLLPLRMAKLGPDVVQGLPRPYNSPLASPVSAKIAIPSCRRGRSSTVAGLRGMEPLLLVVQPLHATST